MVLGARPDITEPEAKRLTQNRRLAIRGVCGRALVVL